MSYPYGLMELIPEMRGEGEGIADYVEGNSGVSGGALQSQRQKNRNQSGKREKDRREGNNGKERSQT